MKNKEIANQQVVDNVNDCENAQTNSSDIVNNRTLPTKYWIVQFISMLMCFIVIVGLTHIGKNKSSNPTVETQAQPIETHETETMDQTSQNEPTIEPTITESDPDHETEPTTPQTEIVEYGTYQICFMGDETATEMQNSVFTDVHFITNNDVDAQWLTNGALNTLTKLNDIQIVVVLPDIYNINDAESYAIALNQLSEKCSDKIFICANIGPIDESKTQQVTNEQIADFNRSIASLLSDRWQMLDQYSYVSIEGFTSKENTNYSTQDYAKIFIWMVNSVKRQEIIIKN